MRFIVKISFTETIKMAQIVEYKDNINFAVKLDDLDTNTEVVSLKQNIGHLLWFCCSFI